MTLICRTCARPGSTRPSRGCDSHLTNVKQPGYWIPRGKNVDFMDNLLNQEFGQILEIDKGEPFKCNTAKESMLPKPLLGKEKVAFLHKPTSKFLKKRKTNLYKNLLQNTLMSSATTKTIRAGLKTMNTQSRQKMGNHPTGNDSPSWMALEIILKCKSKNGSKWD